jgi:hypothetical protein
LTSKDYSNLIGKKFSRLTIKKIIFKKDKSNRIRVFAKCDCICNSSKIIRLDGILEKRVKSCGCWSTYVKTQKNPNTEINKPKNILKWSASNRSRVKDVPFDINIADYEIPKKCPVLGIRIFKKGKFKTDNSATLDRFVPDRGYVKDNVMVISDRANRLKRDMDLYELKILISYLKKLKKKGLDV